MAQSAPVIPLRNLAAVKIIDGSLRERKNGELVLHGYLDFDSLKHLQVDDYQREVLKSSGSGGRVTGKISRGLRNGAILPPIELGMRGDHVNSRGGTYFLNDPVYIIDGLQRVTAMIDHMEDADNKNSIEPLGAVINFKTTKQWEKERFRDLNTSRTAMSPNVILRNERDKHPSILTLYGLSTNDPSFALYQRVCWNQRMNKRDLVSASALVRAASGIHRHVIEATLGSMARPNSRSPLAGVVVSRTATGSPVTLDKVAKQIGLQNFRQNLKDFFELIDKCWGIRAIEYGEAQGHLRGNFIAILSGFISNNPQLWSDDDQRSIVIDPQSLARFKSFPVNDPEIRRLASAGTMVLPTLYNYLLNHMNKHMKKHKFK